MSTLNDVWVAYREAQGRWTGCNWPTHCGSLGLDLRGFSSVQAHNSAGRWRSIAIEEIAGAGISTQEEHSLVDMALHLRLGRRAVCLGTDGHLRVCGNQAGRFCAETLSREWEFAAYWLEEIESDARWAEDEAREAVRAAEQGDWPEALDHARQACLIQSGYKAARPWTPFRQQIEKAAR